MVRRLVHVPKGTSPVVSKYQRNPYGEGKQTGRGRPHLDSPKRSPRPPTHENRQGDHRSKSGTSDRRRNHQSRSSPSERYVTRRPEHISIPTTKSRASSTPTSTSRKKGYRNQRSLQRPHSSGDRVGNILHGNSRTQTVSTGLSTGVADSRDDEMSVPATTKLMGKGKRDVPDGISVSSRSTRRLTRNGWQIVLDTRGVGGDDDIGHRDDISGLTKIQSLKVDSPSHALNMKSTSDNSQKSVADQSIIYEAPKRGVAVGGYRSRNFIPVAFEDVNELEESQQNSGQPVKEVSLRRVGKVKSEEKVTSVSNETVVSEGSKKPQASTVSSGKRADEKRETKIPRKKDGSPSSLASAAGLLVASSAATIVKQSGTGLQSQGASQKPSLEHEPVSQTSVGDSFKNMPKTSSPSDSVSNSSKKTNKTCSKTTKPKESDGRKKKSKTSRIRKEKQAAKVALRMMPVLATPSLRKEMDMNIQDHDIVHVRIRLQSLSGLLQEKGATGNTGLLVAYADVQSRKSFVSSSPLVTSIPIVPPTDQGKSCGDVSFVRSNGDLSQSTIFLSVPLRKANIEGNKLIPVKCKMTIGVARGDDKVPLGVVTLKIGGGKKDESQSLKLNAEALYGSKAKSFFRSRASSLQKIASSLKDGSATFGLSQKAQLGVSVDIRRGDFFHTGAKFWDPEKKEEISGEDCVELISQRKHKVAIVTAKQCNPGMNVFAGDKRSVALSSSKLSTTSQDRVLLGANDMSVKDMKETRVIQRPPSILTGEKPVTEAREAPIATLSMCSTRAAYNTENTEVSDGSKPDAKHDRNDQNGCLLCCSPALGSKQALGTTEVNYWHGKEKSSAGEEGEESVVFLSAEKHLVSAEPAKKEEGRAHFSMDSVHHSESDEDWEGSVTVTEDTDDGAGRPTSVSSQTDSSSIGISHQKGPIEQMMSWLYSPRRDTIGTEDLSGISFEFSGARTSSEYTASTESSFLTTASMKARVKDRIKRLGTKGNGDLGVFTYGLVATGPSNLTVGSEEVSLPSRVVNAAAEVGISPEELISRLEAGEKAEEILSMYSM